MVAKQQLLVTQESEVRQTELEEATSVATVVAAEDSAQAETQPLHLTLQGCTEVFVVAE